MGNDPVNLPTLKIAPALLTRIRRARRQAEVGLANDAAGAAEKNALVDVIISVGLDPAYPQEGIAHSINGVVSTIRDLPGAGQIRSTEFYIAASLTEDLVEKVSIDARVNMIWPNHVVAGHLLTSVDTVKASACWSAFGAKGDGIVWAVLDTGITEKPATI